MKQTHWNSQAYHSLNYELKERYGKPLYKISLNAGMTCPNRDGTLGTLGCLFCSAGGSGDFAASSLLSIREQIEAGKEQTLRKSQSSNYIAYFQAYTNTYAPVSYLREVFTQAVSHPDIEILSIATRPDCFSEEIFSLLSELNKKKPVWVELGLQTIHEKSAKLIRRGYPLSCFERTKERLNAAGIEVIVHTILGLPGESVSDILETIDYLAVQNIQGIKLQLLHILKGTGLAHYYQQHPFPIYTCEEYADLCVSCLEHLPPEIVIHRLTGDAPRNLLIEPAWSADKRMVLNRIQHMLKIRKSFQGKEFLHV